MNEALAHINDSRAADQRSDARRSEHLDTGAVGTVSRVGAQSEGLRPGTKGETKKKSRQERDKQLYAIGSALKVLKVMEALEGRNFEPVKIVRVMERCGGPSKGFNHNFCLRALRTLEFAGYAKETLDGWVHGPKVEALGASITAARLASGSVTRP